MKILVSACLLGINCKYNGKNNRDESVLALTDRHELIPVCPECLGGLPTPRVPAEIVDGVVRTKDGCSVDSQFREGAREALRIALANKVDCAVLQPRSPSCGVNQIYDGSFTGTLKSGSGIFTSMLKENGIRTIGTDSLESLNGN